LRQYGISIQYPETLDKDGYYRKDQNKKNDQVIGPGRPFKFFKYRIQQPAVKYKENGDRDVGYPGVRVVNGKPVIQRTKLIKYNES
jgi:hypothetical protein